MKFSSFSRLTLALMLTAAMFIGCSRDPNVRRQKYFESGQRYFDKGKYREAEIQFRNALQVDSRPFPEAHYQLARTYLNLQDGTRAYLELNRTVELQPENYEARIDLANLLIAGSAIKQAQERADLLKQAKEHTDLLLAKQPNNPQVHETVANLMAAQTPPNFIGAIQEMQKAVSLGPDRWEAYLNLALLQMKIDQFNVAEANFKKAVQLNPKAMSAQLALGAYYQSHSRFAEAEEQYRHAVQVDPKNPDPRAALVWLYMAEGKRTEAEDFLKQLKHDLADNPAGYRMLGDFYFATGDLDRATTEYSSIYQDHPKDTVAKRNYVQLLILKNRLDEARKLNDELLKANSNDVEALIYRGQIQIREGHPNDATVTLETAIKNDPENGVAHYHLGIAFDQLGNLARAEGEWRDAVRLRPNLVEAHRALAAVALRRNDMGGLEDAAGQIIKLQPGSADGFALRAVSYINRGQFDRAEQDVRKSIEAAPQSPIGYIQMGNLRLAQKQYGEAEKAYQQGLEHDPTSADALAGLMNTYLSQKQADRAITAANAQIAKVPNSSAFYDLLGTVLFNQKKDLTGAEAALKKSCELDKNNADALLKLGQVQVAKGSTDEAIATYQKSIKDNPREASLYILMGEMYESKQDWERAKDAYQKALNLKPDNPVASNNLAYVILQTRGNVDVALSLAQTARRGMPDSPNAADTLGWVFYQKGAYKPAIDLFEEALKLADKNRSPENPTFHYHLGLAYEKNEQPELARRHLERVLKINPNYSSAGDVKALLSQLRS
jgi:tetratricopeptide (TPR) repeat protein